MKNVLLIAPKLQNKGVSGISELKYPLTGLLVLATMLRNRGHSVRFYDEAFKKPDYDKIEDVDIVLISSMSATVKRAYQIANIFKKKGIKVVLGGIHVSFMVGEAIKNCNQVVVGESEEIIFDLVEDKFRSKIVQGIRTTDLSKYPMPDYSLVEGIKKNPDVISVTTSRGCPFACKFCSLVNMFGRKFRSAPTGKVIEHLSQFKKIKTLAFNEPNFTIDKERAIEMLKAMKDNGIFPKNCWSSVSIDVANNDKLLKIMSEVSNFHLLVGLESINQKALNFYNKKQTPEMIKKAIKKLHNYGIKVIGSFIFGADSDDKSVFKRTIEFCNSTEVDFPTFTSLTPYVGTEIRRELVTQKRILTNNWDFYDGIHTVILPKKMSPIDLQEGVITAYRSFYSTNKVINHLKKKEFTQAVGSLYVKNMIRKGYKKNKPYFDYLRNFT
jgi:radical SAM superfamily enzyme YgiQ (UPF0313 family)